MMFDGFLCRFLGSSTKSYTLSTLTGHLRPSSRRSFHQVVFASMGVTSEGLKAHQPYAVNVISDGAVK